MRSVALSLLLLAPCCAAPSPGGWDYHSSGDVGQPVPLDVTADPPGPVDTGLDAPTDRAAPPDGEIVAPDLAATELSEPPRVRVCTLHLAVAAPGEASVALAAEFTDWASGELPMADPDGDGTWELELDAAALTPGSWGYKFHTGSEQWLLDPSNPLAKWVDGVENSKLVVPDCEVPGLELLALEVEPAAGSVTATVAALDVPGGIDPGTAQVLLDGQALAPVPYDPVSRRFHVTVTGRPRGSKVTLRFRIGNAAGPAEELVLPLWLEDEGEWSWRDAVLYFAFTDRFADATAGDGPPDCAPDHLANWKGGDWAGITQRIEDGTFTALGVNVLWVSPPYDNPDGCCEGEVAGEQYTAYHGYFPVSLTEPEERFGTMDDLRALTAAAHARGIRVIADLVANHVHSDSPLYQAHKDDGWFHPYSPCAPAWDKPVECWFQPYMPDLDHTVDAVVETVAGSAVHWALEADLDGFRVDAVKHMSHNFPRTLRWKLSRVFAHATHPMVLIGETFMGDWGGGSGFAETGIKEYVNAWELDGQFDFPLYWALLRSTGRDEADFASLGAFLAESHGYYGPDALMSSFMGNHDVPRFISHAAGDIADLWGNGSKEQGWYAPPSQPASETPYLRARLAFGLLMTLPQLPLVYYGDEIGLAGAGDPDNRRPMPWGALSDHQETLRGAVQLLGGLRKELTALRRGGLEVVSSLPQLLVFRRTHVGGDVVVAASRSPVQTVAEIPVTGLGGALTERLSGETLTATDGAVSLTLPPYGLAVLTGEP